MDGPAQVDDITPILRSLPPDELVKARNQIDALLTPKSLRLANQKLSPLLRLPRNILEHIIGLAVSYGEDVEVDGRYRDPGILQTCHSLRTEALREYLGRNTFKRKRSPREEGLERWVKERVGENRRYLKRVRLGPPLHCNNEEAEIEAQELEERCGLQEGTVWVLSDDDFENDFQWWVNSLGKTQKMEPSLAELTPSNGILSGAGPSTSGPAASWYCSSWMARRDSPNETPIDYFSLRQGILTPQSQPSRSNVR